MAGSGPCQARLRRLFRAHRRRSSVVEHVIGNDGVSSSILLGGTMMSNGFRGLDGRLDGKRKRNRIEPFEIHAAQFS